MKILFTKKLNEVMISNELGSHFSCDFLETIHTETIQTTPFNLENKSLIFTSLNGVKSFFENGFEIQNNKIYCVGKNSEKFLKAKGFPVLKTAKNASELAEFILKNKKTETFLHFAGNISLNEMEDRLTSYNIDYEKVIIYKTMLLYPQISKKYDAIVFFSPS